MKIKILLNFQILQLQLRHYFIFLDQFFILFEILGQISFLKWKKLSKLSINWYRWLIFMLSCHNSHSNFRPLYCILKIWNGVHLTHTKGKLQNHVVKQGHSVRTDRKGAMPPQAKLFALKLEICPVKMRRKLNWKFCLWCKKYV